MSSVVKKDARAEAESRGDDAMPTGRQENGALPASWACAALDELGTWSGGGTPAKSKPEFWTNGTIPWVSPKDMKGFKICGAEFQITEEAIKNSAARKVPPRSILMVTRSGILSRVFPVGITSSEVTINQDLKALTPNVECNPEYLAWYLVSEGNRILTDCRKHGTTVASIEFGRLKQYQVPVAPHAEQGRIVEKIEALFARIEKGEEALRQIQALLGRYRQSILKAAVTGALTREWREARQHELEPASQLLDSILVQRRANWQGRGTYKEPVSAQIDGLPEMPDSWLWASIEECVFVETGATPKKSENKYYSEQGVNWITSTALNDDPVVEPQAYITEAALKETNAKIFPQGTLIVAMYGEGKTRGKVAELGIEAATNQACAALRVEHLDPNVSRYVKTYLLYNYEAIRKLSAGGVQPNLNLGMIRSMAFPLPPLPEIKEILVRVDQELQRCKHIGLLCETELARSASLRQSILKSAFSGQLVPQDPGDEPASELLARFRDKKY